LVARGCWLLEREGIPYTGHCVWWFHPTSLVTSPLMVSLAESLSTPYDRRPNRSTTSPCRKPTVTLCRLGDVVDHIVGFGTGTAFTTTVPFLLTTPEWAVGAFSVWTGFTVLTGKMSAHPRGMSLVTRIVALHAEQQRETQWHSSSVNPCPECKSMPRV
jgi:hypothetical protein